MEDRARRFGDLAVDPAAREATLAGRIVGLTGTEFDILDVLSSDPRRVFSRRTWVPGVWGRTVRR
jgi:DNA-binding response OmpR family regulator